MADKCRERIANGGDTNYHIFINSVEDITAIILSAGLSPDNTKVVCSTSEGGEKRNKEKLPEGFTIGKAGDPPKTINFYTSTCFEGQDIFDEIGETIIVSDSLKKHTMMDISTSFIQIAGRIRNSKYKNKVTQIFSTSRYRKELSAEEYERNTMETLDKVERHIAWMNDCPEDLKESFLKQIPYLNEPYVRIAYGQVILDKNLAYQDIVNYKIVNFDYCSRVNMANILGKNGIEVINSTSLHVEGDLKTKPLKLKATFKELFDLYCEIMTPGKFSLVEDERLTFIRMYKPLVIEAYQKLGPEKVKALKYKVSNIKREITKAKDLKEYYKIAEMLSQVLPLLKPIPRSRIKQEIQKAFTAIGKEGSPSAVDIVHWFDIKEKEP